MCLQLTSNDLFVYWSKKQMKEFVRNVFFSLIIFCVINSGSGNQIRMLARVSLDFWWMKNNEKTSLNLFDENLDSDELRRVSYMKIYHIKLKLHDINNDYLNNVGHVLIIEINMIFWIISRFSVRFFEIVFANIHQVHGVTNCFH